MLSFLVFTLLLLSSIAASILLLMGFTGLMKITTTDRQLRGLLGEYQRVQEESGSLDGKKQQQEELNVSKELNNWMPSSQARRTAAERRNTEHVKARIDPNSMSNNIRQRQSIALNERIKELEVRKRREPVSR